METATLTPVDLEFIELMRSTDEQGQALIWDALICTLAFGDGFLKEWGAAVDSGDREASEAVLSKYRQAAENTEEVKQWRSCK